jgi:acetoin:2,6-dichlorophenolindophenol oxidoreductase subunit alpha
VTAAPPMQDSAVEPLNGIDDADLERMLLIRHFELALLDLFAAGEVSGTTHTCLGQEYVPVAVSGLLNPADVVVSNHRGHGHYLARYDDPEGLLAEIMGRSGGVCSGWGGSQHLHRPGFFSSGVQGQMLPIAVGMALHIRATHQPEIVVVYMGDGTWGEGAVYEALNMAALWEVPLLVVVENNGIAQTTRTAAHMAGDIRGRAHAFGIAHLPIRSIDVKEIRRRLRPVVARMRVEPAPVVVELHTARLGPHSKGDDVRPAAAIAEARRQDWHPRYAEASPQRFARLDDAARERVAAVVRRVAAWPPAHRGAA